ncbi:MAG: hypothetical protein N2662_03520 [Bacteroidales bacterium]|nr:hypothetical protein [Bacteroidales bacterium]
MKSSNFNAKKVTGLAIIFIVISRLAILSQDLQQVSPFFLPKVITAPGTYYILTQGYSRVLESNFRITSGSLTDSSIVIYEFFPVQGAFKVVARSSFLRTFYGAAFYKNKIIIAGGYNAQGTPTQSVYEFDLQLRKWIERKQGMNQKRAEFALEVSGNKLYAIYGDDKGTIEVYDEALGKWNFVNVAYQENTKPLKKIRASVAIENNIYLFSDESNFLVYNASIGKISNGIAPPINLSFFNVINCNRKIYLAGGCDKSGIDYNVYVFNSVDNTWKNSGKISVELCGSGLVCHGRMLIFVGGSTTNMFEKTTPTGNIFIYRPMY